MPDDLTRRVRDAIAQVELEERDTLEAVLQPEELDRIAEAAVAAMTTPSSSAQ